jgi:NAD(P)-dependent dehydrogenase (short-subunit alcohol dehydrogenase family)
VDEFAGTHALVIGGSRGLGAATVRALAAGGATVTLTYARGETEARALVHELGDRVTARQLDVTGDLEAAFATMTTTFDQAYYFATPHIARRTVQWFSNEAFDAFNAVYVRGFARACAAIHARSPKVRIYYPSSVAVDVAQRPREMLEYAMAKSAGEALCADIPRSLRGVRVEVERLPRVATDQTATIVPVEAASAERLALAAVRRMHASV